MAYCGQTREPGLSAELSAAGIGECTVRGEVRSRRRSPWFYDNGAFRDWRAGVPFDAMTFCRDMRRIRYTKGAAEHLTFVIVPDLVADGEASLATSKFWRHEVDAPAYLAVQDGMTEARVATFLDDAITDGEPYAGLFVGGSLEWKLATSAGWVELAHGRGIACHVGRVGTPDRVRWAASIGADSIDSCLPLMHRHHLDRFLGALAEVKEAA